MVVSHKVFSAKYVPEWFPGAGFRKKARRFREHAVKMNAAPLEAVNNALVNRSVLPHYCTKPSRNMELRKCPSHCRCWTKFSSKEMRPLGKVRSYETPDCFMVAVPFRFN